MKNFKNALGASLLALGFGAVVMPDAKAQFLSVPDETVRVMPQSNAQVQLSYAPVV